LAQPLVVAEQMNARDALYRSWEMTKNHFWYVAGCYLFLGLSTALVNWLLAHIVSSASSAGGYGMLSADQLRKLCLHMIQPMWIISAWCMYLEIKALEAEIPVSNRKAS
jgi:hypothetical protein